MNGFETAAFATLWLTLVVLAGLVVVVYKQISRAQTSQLENPTSLPIGELAPELGILENGEMRKLRYDSGSELQLLAFVTTTCSACRRLMEIFIHEGTPVLTTVVVSGNEFREYADPESELLRVRWLINPADARDFYKVNIVPTIYAIRDGRIAAVTTEGSVAGITTALRQAEEIELSVTGQQHLVHAKEGLAT